MDYDERVLPSIGNEVLKSIVAQFDAAELITQREVVCSARQQEFPTVLISIMLGLVKNS
jgi:prohibitin 1